VRNCSVLVSFRNQPCSLRCSGCCAIRSECRELPQDKREGDCQRLGRADLTRSSRRARTGTSNRCILSCHGRGNTNSISVILRGNSPYAQTGVLGREAARRVLRGQLCETGFVSPAKAFGASLAAFGHRR